MPGLGRRYSPDGRDRRYPMRAVLRPRVPERTYRYWWLHGAWLNQGDSGTCVGHAWAHYVEDGPITHQGTIDPFALYREAAGLDEWRENDGEEYDFGTSVRAGAQALLQRGLISEYRWAWDIDTVVEAVLTTGPVVVGSWWYSDMSWPDRNGKLSVSGFPEGGHAYVINGVNLRRGFVRIKNSWGRVWGHGRPGHQGYAFIDLADMDRLIRDDGEACLALEVASRPGR